MSHMLDEIRQEPEIVRTIINTQYKRVEALRDAIVKNDVRFVYIAARGTSDSAARYAKYLFEIEHGLPTALGAPSVFTLYDSMPRFGANSLVIGISQSGAGPDILSVITRAKEAGALTAAITNNETSPLAQAADFTLPNSAGEEQSIAATKTYTGSLAILALLSTALAPDHPERLEHLRRTADVMERCLKLDDAIRQLVSRYKSMTECIVLGRGYNHCTAQEIGLKIAQTCTIASLGMSAADFMHGYVAQVHEGSPVILLAPDGKAYDSMLKLSRSLRERHPAIIAFANNPDFLCGPETAIRVPGPVPEWLSPLVYAVAGQLFTHWLAVAANKDPDRPRGFSKVTKTI